MPRQLCDHCGLPIGAFGYSTETRAFCCYGCFLAWRIVGEQGQAGAASFILVRLGIAGFLAMNIMMASLLFYTDALAGIGAQATQVFRVLSLALATPVMLILGLPFLQGALSELRRGLPSVNSLVAVGAFAGYGVSAVHVLNGRGYVYFDTATMLLVLVTLGRLLEASAKSNAAKSLKSLLQMKPAVARVIGAKGEAELPTEQVVVGDRLRIKPGECVPVDGVVLAGESTVQEAIFTGEAQPRACKPGAQVFGASVNGEGELILQATGVGEGTILAQIARLVEQAQAQRAPVEYLVARVSTLFIPLVLALAAGALGYWYLQGDLARGGMSALAVLVVACPCALGLATPLALSVAIGRAARAGVLIRAGEALETLAQVEQLFFDKTGTLTVGQPVLRRVCGLGGTADAAALGWLATLERSSEHALASAIVKAAEGRGLSLGQVAGFRAFPGQGAVGQVCWRGQSRAVWAGSQAFLAEQGIDLAPAAGVVGEDCETLVFVAWEGQVRGWAALADLPRPEAAQVVRELGQAGISVAVLSGDRRPVVDGLMRELGLTNGAAQCTPLDKVAQVRAARQAGKVVAVVGDGINDAPALAEADIGLAMGGGTDLAREAGGVVLLGDNLSRVPWLLHLSRQTYRTIRQNLAWAFGYNLVAIILAFFGYLHPLLAAVAMLASSLFVLNNSLRLARFGE